jgi:hypothetical protein
MPRAQPSVQHVFAISIFCLAGSVLSVLLACDVIVDLMRPQANLALAFPRETGKLMFVGGIASLLGLLLLLSAGRIRQDSHHRAIVASWSIWYGLLYAVLAFFFMLVFYPLPHHGRHTEITILALVLACIWSGWFIVSPFALQNILSTRAYGVLKVGLVNVVVLALCGEVVMRAADPVLAKAGLFGNKQTPAELTPHMEVLGSIRHSNSQGFKDRERTVENPDHHLRLVALGDSFVWGSGVRYEQGFVAMMETLLQREVLNAEIVNLGVPGWAPPEEFHLLQTYGVQLQPDLVLLNFFVGNDIIRRRGAQVEQPIMMVAGQSYYVHANGNWVHDHFGPERWFLYHDIKYVLTVGALRMQHAFAGTPSTSGMETSPLGRSREWYLQELESRSEIYLKLWPQSIDASWNHTRATMQRMVHYLRDRNIPLAVILIPDQVQVDPQLREELITAFSLRGELYDFGKPQALFHVWCGENDVPCIDLREVFASEGKPSDLFLLNDMHWSVAGHTHAAETVYAQLQSVIRGATKERGVQGDTRLGRSQ